MAFGGMAPVTKLGLKTTAALEGQSWSRDLVSLACEQLAEEFKLPPEVPGAMARYRQSLVLSFFFKFFLTVDNELNGGMDTREVSATEVFTKAAISSGQLYEVKPVPGPEGTSVVGAPLQHRAAEKQVGLMSC
jgi:xanthine dehydrogenase/oxidase